MESTFELRGGRCNQCKPAPSTQMSSSRLYIMEEFTFGKYKGSKIDDIIWFEPSYVQWCVDNIAWFKLSDKQTKELNHFLNIRKQYEYKKDPYCIEGNRKWDDFC